ncbi:MAG TPA: hypothetical protein VKA51_11200 [Rubrobacteraceae bacterium]|nr:hypothetical protein [Rubrobacteraceae bacterium]
MTPEAAQGATSTTLYPMEARISGGMLALARFLMTLQNKRMPVAHFTVGRDRDALRITLLLDCPPEQARRYTELLAGLEDVEGIQPSADTMEVALLKTRGDGWRESAAGVEVHEEGGTVVASGEPGVLDAWLAGIGDDVEDLVRLGPVARPGNGGD